MGAKLQVRCQGYVIEIATCYSAARIERLTTGWPEGVVDAEEALDKPRDTKSTRRERAFILDVAQRVLRRAARGDATPLAIGRDLGPGRAEMTAALLDAPADGKPIELRHALPSTHVERKGAPARPVPARSAPVLHKGAPRMPTQEVYGKRRPKPPAAPAAPAAPAPAVEVERRPYRTPRLRELPGRPKGFDPVPPLAGTYSAPRAPSTSAPAAPSAASVAPLPPAAQPATPETPAAGADGSNEPQ